MPYKLCYLGNNEPKKKKKKTNRKKLHDKSIPLMLSIAVSKMGMLARSSARHKTQYSHSKNRNWKI